MIYPFYIDLHPLLWGTEVWMLPPAEIAEAFPLLIKFIDPHQDLSIQVHPDDAYAQAHGLPRGKTEMWFVTDATPDAHLYSGLKDQLTPEQYARKVEDGTIADALRRYNPRRGDCFFLPAGRIHALGSGAQVCEVQQKSNTTYRIFDYNRRDAQGNLRELHTQQAADCIDYTVLPDYQTHYQPVLNQPEELVSCAYFTTRLLDVDGTISRTLREGDPQTVFIIMSGEASLRCDQAEAVQLNTHDVVAVEADEVQLTGRFQALEVTGSKPLSA